MNKCRCEKLEIIDGEEATLYSKEHLEKVAHQGGWVQLWKCPNDKIYFEATWVGGQGFYNGIFSLRKISSVELLKSWSEYLKK